MWKLALVLIGGCYATQRTRPCYEVPYSATYSYVDGQYVSNRGVAYGEAPEETVIPTDDPPVGDLTPPASESE